jgi:cytochrome d ubiquinol oxidase subunit II
VTLVAAFALHGALFLSLRTRGELEQRARQAALRLWPVAGALLIAFLTWTSVDAASSAPRRIVTLVMFGAGLIAAVASLPLAFLRRLGAAFAATAAAIVLVVAGLFLWLYPNVLVSNSRAPSLTIFSTSSNHYSLVAMTIVAVLFVPVVLAYQAWALWVFRARLGKEDFEGVHSPIDLLARTPLGRRPEAEG